MKTFQPLCLAMAGAIALAALAAGSAAAAAEPGKLLVWINGDKGYILNGIPNDEVFGSTVPVSAAGDFNGDGFEDFVGHVLGATAADSPEVAGAAEVAGREVWSVRRIDQHQIGLLGTSQRANPVELPQHLRALHRHPGQRFARGDGRGRWHCRATRH